MDQAHRQRVLEASLHLAPDLSRVFEDLESDPESVVARAFPTEDPRVRGALVRRLPTDHPLGRGTPFEAGRRGLAKLARDGRDADLDDDEALDLETLVAFAVRPAILIREGSFLAPPQPWERLEESRGAIERVAASVGRIQFRGSRIRPFAGTGFVVGPDLVMTNRHVVETFGEVEEGVFTVEPGLSSGVDFADDPDVDQTPEFAVETVVVHPTFDLALVKVASQGTPLPVPLTLATEPPTAPEPGAQHDVYVVGYPGRDTLHAPDVLHQVFADIFDVKRLQPGGIMAILDPKAQFNHDCSTLGGNSGSCVVDLATHKVLGLHFAGKFMRFNRAVALWRFQDDPLLKAMNFG